MPTDLEIRSLGMPTEMREFDRGRFEVYRIGGHELGRAVYQPGWRWSEHVGPVAETELCESEHVGLVVRGRAAVRMRDGREVVLTPGDLFAIPSGHDSWVIGSERYVSIHLVGASAYTLRRPSKRR